MDIQRPASRRAAAPGALCCKDVREVVAWACSVEVAPCYPVRCPQSAPQPLARFASMMSAKLWRGHALSAEHECGAQASRVDRVACAKKKKGHMFLLLRMMDDDEGCWMMVMMLDDGDGDGEGDGDGDGDCDGDHGDGHGDGNDNGHCRVKHFLG